MARKQNNRTWTLALLRKAWQEFFEKEGHLQMPSASLLPAGDPTLLFTTAGMVQFKSYFAGTEEPPRRRVYTIQKCLRTTDLESVGKTSRHCTFFEMLGNFSFGDYFKREAIQFSWQFSLDVLKFDPDLIHISIYTDDDEAEEIWNKEIGVPLERIVRLGKEDNWWGPAGDQGACGPCSELYLDRGPDYCECPPEQKLNCAPGGDCDRYMEYWNLVFNQFHQDTNGKLHDLPQTGIDTGAGLERLATLLADVDSVYDTDELARIIRGIEDLTETKGEDGRKKYRSDDPVAAAPFRVITDHLRAACFTIGDGIFPGNTGRNYVVRRIIRRALLFARELGIHEPILHLLVDLVAEIYGDFYPEVRNKKDDITRRIKGEEERFLRTLATGIARFDEFLDSNRDRESFSGDDAFTLYDTFGFPLEMTIELAEKQGLTVDTKRFEKRMQEQQKQSSQGARFKDIALPADLKVEPSEFIGYDNAQSEAKLVGIIHKDQSVERLAEGASAILVLDRTPFYPEGGGQVGDIGEILSDDGAVFEVQDTRIQSSRILHLGRLKSGELKTGDAVNAYIDQDRRQSLTRHHSATHLLNDALRSVLGDHIMQTGSLVAPDYLRFDFSHPERIDHKALQKVESLVNQAITKRGAVLAEVLPIEEARKRGAIAAFDEKYGAEVRVISMGNDGELSIEFCGGCHVKNTGDVQLFHILREASPGAGNRRIEAIAGPQVISYFQNEMDELRAKIEDYNRRVIAMGEKDLTIQAMIPNKSAEELLSTPAQILELENKLQSARSALLDGEKKYNKLQKKKADSSSLDVVAEVDDLLAGAEKVGPVLVVSRVYDGLNAATLRQIADRTKEKSRGVAALLASRGDRPALLFAADKKANEAGVNCSDLIRESAAMIGGGGGGRPDMAQAGGKDSSRIEEALERAADQLRKELAVNK